MSAAGVGTRWLSAVPDSVQAESAAPVDFEYWLAHCEGYRVDSAGGRVGIVEDVRHAEGVERAESLAVLAGMFGRRRLIIDADQVNAIVPHEQCVLLKANATSSEPSSAILAHHVVANDSARHTPNRRRSAATPRELGAGGTPAPRGVASEAKPEAVDSPTPNQRNT